MKKEKKKPKIIIDEEESESEDWCFICKDGGELIVCGSGGCPKVYHAHCVRKIGSCSEVGDDWTCDRHICSECHKTPSFNCFCCPNAVCKKCIRSVDFVVVKDDSGLCDECLKLVLLGEEDEPCDSDGDIIDFNDRNTEEGLFKEYWEIIKEQEGLTVDDIHAANGKVKKKKKKKNKSRKRGSVSSKLNDDDEDCVMHEDEDTDEETESDKPKRKRKAFELDKEYTESRKLNKKKSGGLQFCGWASKPLIEFLKSIGKDTTEPLSHNEAEYIIKSYIRKNKLVDPGKTRRVCCDERLFSVFRKKTLKMGKIYHLLESHFVDSFEEHDLDNSGEKKDDSNGVETNFKPTGFASIVPGNVKLIYLRRSLVEELIKQPESFEQKVVGSLIRIKNDAKDCRQENFNQLLPVTGVDRSSTGEIFLNVSSMSKGVRIRMLLDSDVTENECLDLQDKMENGVLKKLPMVELEEKARSLHEDITKHWIQRELIFLQKSIDYANEKGRRRELNDSVERREILEDPCYQQKLLEKFPEVIPEVAALKADSKVEEIDS